MDLLSRPITILKTFLKNKPLLSRFFLLVIFPLMVYAPSLFNGFVGDDNVLIVTNSFYNSGANLPRLFSKEYNAVSNDYFINLKKDKGTGSVAYRPVLSLTYFIDSWLWGKNPFGYHAHNLFYHIANTLLVYLIASQIFPAGALLTAVLFSLHPVQTEAVCAVGYRADLLACFFTLAAFYAWLRARKKGRGELFYALSAASFFLAVFSKESAVMFPVAVLIYKMLFPAAIPNKKFIRQMAGYLIIAGFYLYIYFIVFPNTTLGSSSSLMGAGGIRFALRLWREYLSALLFPWTVTVLPALYAPPVSPWGHPATLLDIAVFLLSLGFLAVCWRKNKKIFFCALWFIVFYIPVSSIFFNVNPMAYRFIYLPSVGMFFLIAFGLTEWGRRAQSPKTARLVVAAAVGLYAACTFPAVFLWKNNFTSASEWVRKFPEHHKGYSVLAREYYRRGNFREAGLLYQKSLARGSRNPNDVYELAVCYLTQDNAKKAEGLLTDLIRDYPAYADALVTLAGIRRHHGDLPGAIALARQAVRSAPNHITYYYVLIDNLLSAGNLKEAQALLEQSRKIFGESADQKKLDAWFAQRIPNKNFQTEEFP